ncbi:MAG TPA: YbaB/EbfC family nucleoid-associated protein [Streptosporangiaceae bacterium]|nr:YbaB/EbfC family nucleoid-associated protein [Streptosporangiaceae bacterium]
MEPQMDMQQLFAAAQQMQQQLMDAQQALADAEVTGTASGGLVRATVNGQGELMDLSIDASVIDPADPEETAQTIADLVLAAVRDAYRSAEALQQQQMGPFAAAMSGAGMPGGLNLPGGLDLPPGLDLSGLGIGAPAGHDDDPDEDDDPET